MVLTASNRSTMRTIQCQRAARQLELLDGGRRERQHRNQCSIASPGNGLGGTLGSFSALGGTNSLVSVDALQEFRIQTSTYAPEFGRTPGGQISIVTRSGTNQFHGTVFDYLRNDVLDANDWFADSATASPKAEERQNDFGGTFGGPILKDRTFFFFSYEGLRLRLPQVTLSNVPDLNARQTAVASHAALPERFSAAQSANDTRHVADGYSGSSTASYSNSPHSMPTAFGLTTS